MFAQKSKFLLGQVGCAQRNRAWRNLVVIMATILLLAVALDLLIATCKEKKSEKGRQLFVDDASANPRTFVKKAFCYVLFIRGHKVLQRAKEKLLLSFVCQLHW